MKPSAHRQGQRQAPHSRIFKALQRQRGRHLGEYSVPEQLIRHAFFLSVWCLEQCHDMTRYHRKVTTLSQIPEGTVVHALGHACWPGS